MGAKEILAYRDQVVMSAKHFIELWLEEYPKDDPHDAALILAELVKAYRNCIHIPNKNPKFDYLNDDIAAARNKIQSTTIAGLRAMAAERKGVDTTPTVSLNRDALAEAFQRIEIPGPRFLYPPSPAGIPPITAGLRQNAAPTADPRAAQLASGLCTHSEDFRTVLWYGEGFDFSGRQAKAIEALWLEWKKGDLGLSQQTIGDIIDSASERFQLRDIFRKHRAWGRMIHPAGGKGIFRLGPPPA